MAVFAKMVSAVVAVSLLWFLLGSRFLEKKKSGPEKLVWLILCATILGGAKLILPFVWMPVLLWMAAVGVLVWQFKEATTAEIFGTSLLAGILRAASLGVVFLLRRTFPDLTATTVTGPELTCLFALVVCAALTNGQWRSTPKPLLPLIPCWLVAVVLSEEIIRLRAHESAVVLVFFCLVWLLYCCWQVLLAGQKMQLQSQSIQEEKLREQHYALQEEYYTQLQIKQAQTRALWHDMDKYIRAAQVEGSPGETLERLKAMVSSAADIVDVGERVLNVILNEYAQLAKATGVTLRLSVQVPEPVFVSVADLYVILGNTMDNALEACRALPVAQRQIDLRLRQHHDILYYRLENPVSPAEDKPHRDGRRGYGLGNVQRCVERYHGSLEISRQAGQFVVMAHMNRPGTSRGIANAPQSSPQKNQK